MNSLKSVLLVDDDNINNFINERLLTKNNFCDNIVIKNNGDQALSYLQNECLERRIFPDLILLDINMPVINGIEFIEILHKLNIAELNLIKICILSTSENESDLQKVNKMGDFFWVSKPLTQEKLIHILEFNFHSQG